MSIKLTKNEMQLALRLADSGPTEEESIAWVSAILARRDRRTKRWLPKLEVIHITEVGGDLAWCGYKIKEPNPTGPAYDKRPGCRKCWNILFERNVAMDAAVSALAQVFRDNVSFNNEVYDILHNRWMKAAE